MRKTGIGCSLLLIAQVLGGAFPSAVAAPRDPFRPVYRSSRAARCAARSVSASTLRTGSQVSPPGAQGLMPATNRWPGILPPLALQRTKAATVFVRVDATGGEVQGTGFLALRRGLVLTNAHVATPDDAKGKVRVVLYSGTRGERTLTAQVIASDANLDIAFLQVTGANLPEPLPLAEATGLVETMPLYVFGFPFGDGLASQGRNPEPSVLRASVACLRHSSAGLLEMIQLDGELQPGNSGGPVVDELGRVVGITVSRLRSTRIGFAIPGDRLARILARQARVK
jgi:S1-C subfamily serine protease